MNSYKEAIDYVDGMQLSEERRKVVGFVFLWMVCNQAFKDMPGTSERNRFVDFFKSKTTGDALLELGPSILGGFRDTNDTMDRESVNNTTAYGPDKVSILDSSGNFTQESLARVIYQIRCNLFHGDKNISQDEDIALIGWAYDVIDNLIVRGNET